MTKRPGVTPLEAPENHGSRTANLVPRKVRASNGVIAIITIIVVTVFALAVLTSVTAISTSNLQLTGLDRASEQTFDAAEAGINDALYKLSQNVNQPSYDIPPGGIFGNTGVHLGIAGGGFPKSLTATATDTASHVVRSLHITVHLSSFGGFNGAVQAANNFALKNGASVTGDVYVNGNITGLNNSFITGNVTSAGTIDGIIIKKGQVVANIIQNQTKICDNATYVTIDSGHNSSLEFLNAPTNPPCDAPLTPGVGQQVASAPASVAFPNPNLENFILGTLYPTLNGLAHLPSFTVPKNSTLSLGPAYLDGDLDLNQNSTLKMTGPIWVHGHINFNGNNGIVEVDPARGADSDIIVTDNDLNTSNNSSYQGTGHVDGGGNPDSFIMVVSRSASPTAIDANNNVATAVFYAPFGTIHLSNGLTLKNATGKDINLDNATVVYTDKLKDLLFGSVPTKVITADSWQEQ